MLFWGYYLNKLRQCVTTLSVIQSFCLIINGKALLMMPLFIPHVKMSFSLLVWCVVLRWIRKMGQLPLFFLRVLREICSRTKPGPRSSLCILLTITILCCFESKHGPSEAIPHRANTSLVFSWFFCLSGAAASPGVCHGLEPPSAPLKSPVLVLK